MNELYLSLAEYLTAVQVAVNLLVKSLISISLKKPGKYIFSILPDLH